MGRKTFEVAALKKMINVSLADSSSTPEAREALATVLSSMLMGTNNYAGFRYLTENEVPKEQLPGIRSGGNHHEWFVNVDRSRVYYF